MTRRLLGLLTAGAVLVALGLYLTATNDDARSDSSETVRDMGPDITAQHVKYEQLDTHGRLHYRLTADSIAQYQEDRLTRMVGPHIHLVNTEQPPWNIQAARGYIRNRPGPSGAMEDIVYLRENVSMVQIHPTRGQLSLRGESFYIYPDRQFAESSEHVMIDSNVGRTNAAGIQADLVSGLLTLASDRNQRVHTIVLPQQFKRSQS